MVSDNEHSRHVYKESYNMSINKGKKKKKKKKVKTLGTEEDILTTGLLNSPNIRKKKQNFSGKYHDKKCSIDSS